MKMKPTDFVDAWENKHGKLTPVHHDLMLERLLVFGVRSIDKEWIIKAIDEDGLQKLVEIFGQAREYQRLAKEKAKVSTKFQAISNVRVQGNSSKRIKLRENDNLGELWALCNDHNALKRLKAAESPQATPSILEKLSNDHKDFIREAVARNINSAVDTLTILAKDISEAVRIRVASNPRTAFSTINMLLNDNSKSVADVAKLHINTPRKYHPTIGIYSIAMTPFEESHPEIVIIDANVILLLEEWARGKSTTKNFGDLNESLKSLMPVIRGAKSVVYNLGVLEAAWPSPKKEIANGNKLLSYNKNRASDLQRLIEYLLTGTELEMESWLMPERNHSLSWPNHKKDEFNSPDSMSNILELWISVCLLIDHLVRMEGEEKTSSIQRIPLQTRINYFKEYLVAVEEKGLSIEGEVVFLARMGFFGGIIKRSSRHFTFDEVTKRQDWGNRGLLAIGRNIAMDLSLIIRARDFRLTSSTRSGFQTAVITADQGLLAIMQYINDEWREPVSGRLMVNYKWPHDSEIHLNSSPFIRAEILDMPVFKKVETKLSESRLISEIISLSN